MSGTQLAPPVRKRSSPVWSTLGILFLLGAGGFLLWAIAPSLKTDWQIRDSAVVAKNARLEHGRCRSQIVLHICDATLSGPGPGGGRITRDVTYLFATFNLGGFTATPMADPAHPEWLTTDLGLDHLWNRTISALVAAGLLLLVLIAPVLGWMRRRRTA